MTKRVMATDDSPTDSSSLTPLRPALPSDLRSWLVTAVSATVAYLLVSHGMMMAASGWQVPLFVGAIAALAASSAFQGALVGTITVAAGMAALPPSVVGARFGPLAWVLGVLLTLGLALAIGVLRERGSDGRRTVDVVLACALVVWLLVSLWAPLFVAGFPPNGYGAMRAATIREVPKPHTYVNDDALYRRIYYLMHTGEPYYQAFRDAWAGLGQSPAFPSSVTSVRLPTMYWVWALMPADPFSIAYLFLAAATLGVVAAAFIAGQLAGARFAPLAAAALVAYAMGSAITVYVTYVDLPAMCVALVGVALLLRGRIAQDLRYLWAAAAIVTFAALTREILIYITLLALVTAFFEPAERRWRCAAPWFASLGVFAAGYAAHVAAVRGMLVPESSAITYWKGSPLFALDSLARFTDLMTGNGVLLVILFALGVAGAIASRKRAGLPFALFASAALIAPMLTMLKVGNPGIDAAGNQVNYWGNLFVPMALAVWPAWVLLMPAAEELAAHEPQEAATHLP